MTLGQFAVLVGAPPRWVQNARAQLRLRGKYDEAGAQRLGLARTLAEATGMPLDRAHAVATEALAAWPGRRAWSESNADGSIETVIDVERYQSAFAVRLSLARASYAERVRGRRTRRDRDPVAAARDHGIDVTLLDDALRRTPAQRLTRLDEMSEFFRTARVVGR